MNYTQQLWQLIRMQTGLSMDRTVRKFTGRPILVETLRAIAADASEQTDWVLTHGK